MSKDISSRLAALRQHFENFTISGRGIQVQGSIKDGFVIAAGVGDGGAGTGSSPSTEGAPVYGYFEGDADFPVDPTFDVTVDNPFGFTILWIELSAASPEGRVFAFWGEQGGGAQEIWFVQEILLEDGGGIIRFVGEQEVPELGFVQFAYPDPAPPCGFHYKIRYVET